jgi:hypothetical protein
MIHHQAPLSGIRIPAVVKSGFSPVHSVRPELLRGRPCIRSLNRRSTRPIMPSPKIMDIGIFPNFAGQTILITSSTRRLIPEAASLIEPASI